MKGEERERIRHLDSDALIALLSHSDNNRGLIAIVLGERKERRAVDALINLLQDNLTPSNDGYYAASALGEIGDKKAVEYLIAVLDKPFVRGAVVEALAKLHDDKALLPLIQLFEQSHDSSLATVLGNWGDTRAVDSLIAAMSDPDSHVRFYTARALGKLCDHRALPVLEWARDKDTTPITDTSSIRRKSVSYVATIAIQRIREAQQGNP